MIGIKVEITLPNLGLNESPAIQAKSWSVISDAQIPHELNVSLELRRVLQKELGLGDVLSHSVELIRPSFPYYLILENLDLLWVLGHLSNLD